MVVVVVVIAVGIVVVFVIMIIVVLCRARRHGYVGNKCAVFPLQLLGFEVCSQRL